MENNKSQVGDRSPSEWVTLCDYTGLLSRKPAPVDISGGVCKVEDKVGSMESREKLSRGFQVEGGRKR